MIKYNSPNQLLLFEDFKSPFGDKLSKNNRWVVLASILPWDDLVSEYYKCLSANTGAPSKPGRLIIASLIIKHKLNLSDEETVLQIQENSYLQYFAGYSEYSYELPFDPSLFVTIRKRIGMDIFEKMNQKIIDKSTELEKGKYRNKNKNDDDQPPSNKGKLLMDATVAEQMIKFPTDLDLLNESREISESIIDFLSRTLEIMKPRTYRRQARSGFLSIAKQKNKSKKTLRKHLKKQMNYLRRNFRNIDELLNSNKDIQLPYQFLRKLCVIKEIYRQQREMYVEKKNKCDDRIVSISQPHVRPIVRGKADKKTEFGAKLGVCMSDGFAVVDNISWDAYNESRDLIAHCENYRKHFGYYPETVLGDNIYGNRANREYMKVNGIRFCGKPLGRKPKNVDPKVEKRRKKDYRDRIPIEGKFGQGKNGYNLNVIRAKLKETSESWIYSIFFVMNIVNLTKKLNNFFSTKILLLIWNNLNKNNPRYLKVS